MDFMRRGCSPLSLTQMHSTVNGIMPLQIKLKLLGVLYRLNMQVRADSSDKQDSSHCFVIKRHHFEYYGHRSLLADL